MSLQLKTNTYRGAVVVIFIVIAFFLARNALAPEITPVNSTNEPALSGVPLVDPESVGSIIVERKTQKEYISNQIIVEFHPDVSEQESLDIINEVGGVMLQRFTLAPMFLIRVKDAGDGVGSANAIVKLNKNTKVKNAELNYLSPLDNLEQE